MEESREYVFQSVPAVAMEEGSPPAFVPAIPTLNVARTTLATLLREVEPASRLVHAAALMSLDIAPVLPISNAAWAVAVAANWGTWCLPPATRLALPRA